MYAANTWEQKTVVFPPDTAGSVFTSSSSTGLQLNFWLASNTTYGGGTRPTGWAARVAANRAPGQVNLGAVTGNSIRITGVQLETGIAPTPFARKTYGESLERCQRYFQRFGIADAYGRLGFGGQCANSGQAQFMIPYIVPTRVYAGASISVTTGGTLQVSDGVTGTAITSISKYDVVCNQRNFGIQVFTGATLVQYRPVWLEAAGSASGFIAVSADL